MSMVLPSSSSSSSSSLSRAARTITSRERNKAYTVLLVIAILAIIGTHIYNVYNVLNIVYSSSFVGDDIHPTYQHDAKTATPSKIDDDFVDIVDDDENDENGASNAAIHSSTSTSTDSNGILIPTHAIHNSTLQSDILKITHEPMNNLIIIHFKSSSDYEQQRQQRQCKTPIVRGRLSGPYLSIINWQQKFEQDIPNTNTSTSTATRIITKLIGSYQVPATGTYYIEIIGIMCNHHFYIKDDNFKPYCLIHPTQHRLTSDYAYINVNVTNDENDNEDDNDKEEEDGRIGYWKWNAASTSLSNTTSNTPLYTRYQPHDCHHEEKDLPRCTIPSDILRFDPFEYVFNSNVNHTITSFIQQQQQQQQQQAPSSKSSSLSSMTKNNDSSRSNNQNSTVCILGFSHSRYIVSTMNQILNSAVIATINNQHNIDIQWSKARFPSELHDIQYFHTMTQQFACTHLLVGVGQWPGNRPMLLHDFESDMEEAIKVMLKAKEEMGFKLFLRSIQ